MKRHDETAAEHRRACRRARRARREPLTLPEADKYFQALRDHPDNLDVVVNGAQVRPSVVAHTRVTAARVPWMDKLLKIRRDKMNARRGALAKRKEV